MVKDKTPSRNEKAEPTSKKEDYVYIGKKALAPYILAMKTLARKNDKLIIKARGRLVSKAVEATVIALQEHLKNWKVSNIEIGSEEKTEEVSVSYIRITIEK